MMMRLLPTWWTNKLAVSAAYINSDRDYLVYTMEDTPETTEEPMPQSPSQMLVTMGEEDAAEKGKSQKTISKNIKELMKKPSRSRSKGITTLAKKQGISRKKLRGNKQ